MASAARARPRNRKSQRKARLSISEILLLDVGAVIAEVQQGFPYAAFEELVKRTGLSREIAATAMQTPLRTLARRKEEGRLRPDESDRLLRLARIFGLCLDLFAGDPSEARGWMTTQQLALGGRTPLDYASTEVGAREVESLIGRLEHGIPS